MTARHVLEGCTEFGILTGRKRVERGFGAILSPRHDLAVFRTERSVPALDLHAAPLWRGQDGYHFGYPQGRPADLRSTLLGRMKIQPGNGSRHREPVIAWAENDRVPDFRGELGGISGGPAFDGDGKVVGVTVAGSVRRGRIFTTAPTGLRDMLEQARVLRESRERADPMIGPDNFPMVGRALRQDLVVVKVLCWVH